MMMQTARFLSDLPVQGVKIHLLYVLKGTALAALYEKGELDCLEREEYTNLVVDFLERLRPDIVIQRLTGDPVGSQLVAPSWARDKATVLQRIHGVLEKRDTCQGRLYREATAGTK
jgi:hypothetical protein